VTARTDEKGRKAVENLRRETGNYRIDYILLELSSFNSIQNFVQEFKKRGQHINFLINNAGVLAPPYTITEEGFELQFGVNYMGHFLLTNLLLRENLLADRSRIVCLSSHAHYSSKINFEDLNWTKKYSGYYAYAQSKLANILFARELDRRLKEQGKNITAVSCHPGMVITEMGRHIPWYFTALLFPFTYPISKTAPQGAQTTMYCALAPEVEQLGGAYFADCKHHDKPSPDAQDDNLAKKLWEVSENLAKLK
jgi:retinol dehydrogenase-12